ncbi:Oidioi.mRNA.OKI2018_I69.XSR.g14883.t1.cds [Oikopleura dioica]|uniref:Oidioi.mRNA.OKI2018_I69.XSR.g14883.t1.cds n=1 Tax=Oikopleura dioica TaxID=34765 RepID=A0ABN7SG98_OIKDI|nr:Oidioi.mRNA.OKI2018_I69.XSR.g14883.t1.cds [Oikopleura dioica]
MDSNGFKFSRPKTENGFGPSIIEVLNDEAGINMKSLGELASKGPLGEGWSEDEFLLFADIITDEAIFYGEYYGPDMVIGIIKRFLKERPGKTEFQAAWLSQFVRELMCGIEKYAESQSENEYLKTQRLLARVFDLWQDARSAKIRQELFRGVCALFDDFFIKKELKLPSKHLEFIKLTMLFQLGDRYLPEKSMAKKIVDLILRQEQPAPVQVFGFKFLQTLYAQGKNTKEIFENFDEFANYLEKNPSLAELCRKFQTLSAFDLIEKVMIGKKEFSNAYLSFQRKFGLMMIIIEGSDEVDFIPIFKHETKRTAIKRSKKYVFIKLEIESEELGGQELTIFFNRNSTFHGANTEDVVKREGPFFFTAEKEKSSSFETTTVSPVPASATRELKYDLEPHDRELAPLCRGFESQLKLKRTPANDENSMEEASPSKVSGKIRGSRGSTPGVPVESKNSSADVNLAPPPKKSEAKVLPNSDLPPETMAKLREKFATISQLMPRVEESIEEIESVKKQFDAHLEQREKAREDLRRNVEKVMKASGEHITVGERKKALALMLKEIMEKLIADMTRK